jgi:hypothetical protein
LLPKFVFHFIDAQATKKHTEEDEDREYVVKVVQTKFADEIIEVTREVRCLREVAHSNLVEFGGCWLFQKQVYVCFEMTISFYVIICD